MDLQQHIDWFNQELVSTPTIASHQPHDLYISQHNVHLNQNDPPTPIIVPSNGLFNIQQPLIVSSQASMIEQPIVPSQRIYEPHVVLSQSIKRPHNESFISTKKPRRHTVSSSFPPPILTSNLLPNTSISAPRSAAPDARIHEKIKAYECMTKEQLIKRLLELETRQCQWKECREVFTEPSKLTQHLIETHVKSDKAGTWSCEWKGCSKHAIKRHKLYSHLRIHSGDRPYLCDECGKRFSRPESLATHVKTH